MMLTRSLTAFALAVLLAAQTVQANAQDVTPDPAQLATDEAARQAAAASGPRFDPTLNDDGGAHPLGGCVNEPPESERVPFTTPPGYQPNPNLNGGPGWLVSAPRSWPGPTRPGDAAEISLRDKTATTNRMVYADVYRPDGTFARAGTTLFGSRAGTLSYPAAFRDGAPLTAGVYTIVWRDTITDRYIACDGFVGTP